MFVDRDVMDVLVILDTETEADHKLGECLKDKFLVKYEALPMHWKTMFHATAFEAPQYAHIGYDRQQWSNYYLDKQADTDYIGILDSDSMIYSMMHPVYSIFSSDGRIMLHALAGDHYMNDKVN
jgi:hypothetical protein